MLRGSRSAPSSFVVPRSKLDSLAAWRRRGERRAGAETSFPPTRGARIHNHNNNSSGTIIIDSRGSTRVWPERGGDAGLNRFFRGEEDRRRTYLKVACFRTHRPRRQKNDIDEDAEGAIEGRSATSANIAGFLGKQPAERRKRRLREEVGRVRTGIPIRGDKPSVKASWVLKSERSRDQ
ncbi:hypothetical protein L596_014020 [Steinernema carpocapsae]|uniref:Uncharacterized protein n=1 Tax=Steinernema carpocapsae TaxID=34508 RepID=A0A4U5NBU0_STECR|nr:hypothetical protein L596_014020 [Steinernema carpocapsae]